MTSEELKQALEFGSECLKWSPTLTYKGVVEFKNLPPITEANFGDLYVDNNNIKNYWFFNGSNWEYIDNTKRCPHWGVIDD